MSVKRYPNEFKNEAVKQVTARGHPIADVANLLPLVIYFSEQLFRHPILN